MKLRIETAGENPPTACECCGNVTNAVWGYVYEGDDPIAAYFVHWTSSKADHYANFDFLVGTWGTDSVNDKELISFIYKATETGGGSFMAIDSTDRPAAHSDLCSVALKRDEVVNNGRLMGLASEIIDAVWLGDPRIQEIRGFGPNA
ncbi:MAG: hypothetical protein H6954_06835 [Chromatiaceae bacterium]|nr:hypothetical protein [Chromatiaceae bacterium]